jgi:hypothetical protein
MKKYWRKLKIHKTIMTYFFTIDFVLPTGPKVLAHLIPVMERAEWLLGTLEVIFDWQMLPVLQVFTIIYNYQQQILDAFHQNPSIKGNIQDAQANHLFFYVHHATLWDL